MKSNTLKYILLFIAYLLPVAVYADSIPSAFRSAPEWHLGVELVPAYVIPTNPYLQGSNKEGKAISKYLAAGVKCDLSFNSRSRLGRLYPGLYQGLGVQSNTFFTNTLLGNPFSIYVYQGAPIVNLSSRLSFDYEWKFGAAIGWKNYKQTPDSYNYAVTTPVTAHMGVAFKFKYRFDTRWSLMAGIEATHFSNGNTQFPNGGINNVGVSVGAAYTLNPQPKADQPTEEMVKEADRGRWIFDLIGYGAWRRRTYVLSDGGDYLLPGKFGVAGLQFSPMRQFNRWIAAGVSLDAHYDESAGLPPYWIEGTEGDTMKFRRPSFGKQISVGIAANAEFIMPIFAINVGLGVDMLSPVDNNRFYQQLTLKAFVTPHLFLNAGYRLGDFKQPQNLMLGAGYRF